MAVTTYSGYRAAGSRIGAKAAAPDGTFYFAEWWDGRIYKVDASGTLVSSSWGPYPGSHKVTAIAADADSNLYMGGQDSSWNQRILKITPDGSYSTYLSGMMFQQGVVPGTTLWGQAGNATDVYQIDLTTGTYVTHTAAYPDGNGAPGMVCDSAGNLYIRGNTTIVKITPGGTVNTSWVTVADETTAFPLAIDGDDNLYTSSGHQLIKITPAGSVTMPWSSMVWGRDLTVANGYLYTHDEAHWGQVAKIDLATGAITNPWETVTSPPARFRLMPGVGGIIWGVHYSDSNPWGNVYRFDADTGPSVTYEDIEAAEADYTLDVEAAASVDGRAAATDVLVSGILACAFGPDAAPAAPETYYVGLSYTEPRTDLATGNITRVTEPTTGGYGRVAVTNATGFEVDGRTVTNTASIDFPEATDDYETTIEGVFLADASTGGNVLHAVKIPPRTINSGDVISILTGTLTVTIPGA